MGPSGGKCTEQYSAEQYRAVQCSTVQYRKSRQGLVLEKR